jgi:hypothetical protein
MALFRRNERNCDLLTYLRLYTGPNDNRRVIRAVRVLTNGLSQQGRGRVFSTIFRPVAVASFCLSLCLLLSNPRNALAEVALCTGTQTKTDGFSDNCNSIQDTTSTASAQALGPAASTADSQATDNSNAAATASNGSHSTAVGTNDSSATSTASNDSTSGASAGNSSTASGVASGGSLAGAQADDFSSVSSSASTGSAASATAENFGRGGAQASQGSSAEADAIGGLAQAQATLGSSASASDTVRGEAVAIAFGNSTATAANTAVGAFVCAYATNGSTANASATSAPLCFPGVGGIAAVASPMGNCGPVAETPCASLAASLGAPNAIIRLIDPVGNPNLEYGQNSDLCAMIYVFDDNQNMGECCGCPITPNGLLRLSVLDDLTTNWVTPYPHDAGSVVNVVTAGHDTPITVSGRGNGNGCSAAVTKACNAGCDPTLPYSPADESLLGSATTVRQIGIAPPQLTEVPISDDAANDPVNLHYMQTLCGALLANGSGLGVCNCPSER